MEEGTSVVRRTLRLYHSLQRKRDAEIAERAANACENEEDSDQPIVMRVRHTKDKNGKATVDLSKASKDCNHCGGTGRKPDHLIEDENGESLAIPVVCRCVKRNDGVAKDLLDKLAERAAKTERWDRWRRQRRKEKRRKRKS